MPIHIIILFLVILLCIIFKYYLSKFLCIKTNIFESYGDGVDTALSGQFTEIEGNIVKINNSINDLIQDIKDQNALLATTSGNVLAQQEILNKIQANYNKLNDFYNQLLKDNSSLGELQNNTLSNAGYVQNSINAQIEQIFVAENMCIELDRTATIQKQNIINYRQQSIDASAIPNNTAKVNELITLINTSQYLINESDILFVRYANIANSLIANTALTTFKLTQSEAKKITDNAPTYIGLSQDVTAASNYANQASQKLNAIVLSTDISKDKATKDEIGVLVNNTQAILNKHTRTEDNAKPYDSILRSLESCKDSFSIAGSDIKNDEDIKAKKQQIKTDRENSIKNARNADVPQIDDRNSYVDIPFKYGMIMHYQMNKNNGSGRVKNQVNGRDDLDVRQNIWLSATLRNENSRLDDGIIDTSTGYAGIMSGYGFPRRFTLCFWFNYRGPAQEGVIYMSNLQKYNYHRQNAVRVLLRYQNNDSTRIGVQYLVDGRDITDNRYISNINLNKNEWYHLAIVVDVNPGKIDNTKIFINGEYRMQRINANPWTWLAYNIMFVFWGYHNSGYYRFLDTFNNINMIYIAALPEQGTSKIYLDLLLAYNFELNNDQIRQIYNIERLSSKNNIQACKGSYGQTIMDQSPQYLRFTCPAKKPACIDFVEGQAWGTCRETTVNMKATNMCARSYWDHNDHTDPVKCPYFQPYCAGHVGGVKYGQCYPLSNMKYFEPE